jgi:phosphonate transport system substrate-binding protein
LKNKYLLILALLLFAGPAPADGSQERLTLAVHPYLEAAELVNRFTPLTEYLSRRLDAEVILQISPDYEKHNEIVGRDEADISYVGPAPYVRIIEKYGEKPLLARLETAGSPEIQGVIIVRSDAPFTSLAELGGKRFAFGDSQSTMSHLVPRLMLYKTSIDLDELADYAFVRNHHNVVLGVLLGQFDAGAVKEEVYDEYKDQGIRALARTPAVSEHLFVASSELPPVTVSVLRRHLFNLENSPQGLAILAGIQADITGLAPVTDDDYDTMRKILREIEELGLEVN